MKFAKAAFLRQFDEKIEETSELNKMSINSALPEWKLQIDQVIASLTPKIKACLKEKNLGDLRTDPADFLNTLEEEKDSENMHVPYRSAHLSKSKLESHNFVESISGLSGVDFPKDANNSDEPKSRRQTTMEAELLAMMNEALRKGLAGRAESDKSLPKCISFSFKNGKVGPVTIKSSEQP